MYTNRSGWHRKRVSGRMACMDEKASRRMGETAMREGVGGE
jgi:hypothetical protein